MFCMNCGRELKDGEKFCMNCGTPIEDSTQNPVVETEKPDEKELLKEKYECLATEVETKRTEYEQIRNEAEVEKVREDLVNIHKEIENMLKNAKVNNPAEQVVTQRMNSEPKMENVNIQRKFCPKCGARVDNAKFCGKCGNKLF